MTGWVFKKDPVHSWAFWDGIFNSEECAEIIKIGKSLFPKEATVLSNDDGVYNKNNVIRKSSVSWILPQKEHNWIFERISAIVTDLNSKYFMFDIIGLLEGIQFTEYNSPDGNYVAHTDNSFGIQVRKLSVTIQLSKDNEYEGGELILHTSSKPIAMDKTIGKAIVFPSYVLHEVKPVTKGTRYSLVAWVGGPSFK
jgi:PKHD-type hydroxylase